MTFLSKEDKLVLYLREHSNLGLKFGKRLFANYSHRWNAGAIRDCRMFLQVEIMDCMYVLFRDSKKYHDCRLRLWAKQLDQIAGRVPLEDAAGKLAHRLRSLPGVGKNDVLH